MVKGKRKATTLHDIVRFRTSEVSLHGPILGATCLGKNAESWLKVNQTL